MDFTDKTINEKLYIVYGDVTLGVHGKGFDYIFSYQCGGLESLVRDGREWLYRAPKPTFWRALTDNDRGNRFHLRSGMWLSADMYLDCTDRKVWIDGSEINLPIAPENNRYSDREYAKKVKVEFRYETITVPSAQVTVAYEVEADGAITVKVHYYGTKGLPELPLFGMRFVMPTKAVSYCYKGLSGETYPDRMAGGERGVYEVSGLPVTKYLVPQDCGMHMETEWLRVYRNTTRNNAEQKNGANDGDVFGLQFEMTEEPFAFSCLPYTAEELENATHQEELPPARRTVVSILGAVRGVGGIDSWGADVEPAYHVSAEKDISYAFRIVPVCETL